MVKKKYAGQLLLLPLLLPLLLTAQGSGLPLGNQAYHILDRLEIKTGIVPDFHSSLKTFIRGDAVFYALQVDTAAVGLSSRDRDDLFYIFCDNNEWLGAQQLPQVLGGRKDGRFEKIKGDTLYRFIPSQQVVQSLESHHYCKTERPWFGLFYRSPANYFEIDKPAFHLRINPMVNFFLAKTPGDDPFVFYNQRGLELRGGIDDRLYFYSNITDTQARFPEFVNQFIEKNKALPGSGFYKPYESSVFNSSGAYDYLNGQAFIGFNATKHVGFQFGHGKNFIGDGYRSLFLSDFSHNYLYLKVNWRVWRFHYQNIFTELQAVSSQGNPNNELIPRKYMAAHYLNFNATDQLSFGLFEATIFSRGGEVQHFELQYLNPVILYRSVEHLLNSKDNVLIGLDFKWNLLKSFRLYGQLLMDEYKFDELVTNNRGWWGNKYGMQAGLQYINVAGIDHLDIRAEYNSARPYTYSHNVNNGASYSHYNQPLAHPLGANFREYLFTFRYQPYKRWTAEGRLIRAAFGEDREGENWGGDILHTYEDRVREYDNSIGQGVHTNTTLLGLDLSFQVWHNVFLDLHYLYRDKKSELPERSGTDSYFGGGFRMNVGQMKMDF